MTVEHYDSANCDCVPRHEHDDLRAEVADYQSRLKATADSWTALARENDELRAEKYGPLEDVIKARNALATRVQHAEAERDECSEGAMELRDVVASKTKLIAKLVDAALAVNADVERWRTTADLMHQANLQMLERQGITWPPGEPFVAVVEAEVERLRLADKQWADHVKRLADDRDRLRVQVEETARECGIQKTENERLRAALTEITELELEGDASLDDAIVIADEALNPPPLDQADG